MTSAWQIPISWQSVTRPRAHWLPISAETNRMVPAACGRELNPGFAVSVQDYPTPVDVRTCSRCKWILAQ